jgi:hypothetical protein
MGRARLFRLSHHAIPFDIGVRSDNHLVRVRFEKDDVPRTAREQHERHREPDQA